MFWTSLPCKFYWHGKECSDFTEFKRAEENNRLQHDGKNYIITPVLVEWLSRLKRQKTMYGHSTSTSVENIHYLNDVNFWSLDRIMMSWWHPLVQIYDRMTQVWSHSTQLHPHHSDIHINMYEFTFLLHV